MQINLYIYIYIWICVCSVPLRKLLKQQGACRASPRSLCPSNAAKILQGFSLWELIHRLEMTAWLMTPVPYCWMKKSSTSWQLVYPVIYMVSYTPGVVGFLPLAVSVSTGLKPNSLKSQTVDNLKTSVEVVCGDADHGAMLLFAVLGVLFYPVAIWVALLVITWKYPVWLCSGKGIETGLKPWLCWISGNGTVSLPSCSSWHLWKTQTTFLLWTEETLRKFRVIFGRFKPERYYYCLLLTTMNLAVACIPAIFVSSAS